MNRNGERKSTLNPYRASDQRQERPAGSCLEVENNYNYSTNRVKMGIFNYKNFLIAEL